MRAGIMIVTLAAAMLAAAPKTLGQTATHYTYTWDRVMPINWKPETKERQQYTIAMDFLHVFNSGLKVDFQYQLPNPSQWLQVGLMGYLAPTRRKSRDGAWRDDYYDNGRATMNSSYDSYRRMWGLGTSVLFKKMVTMNGWYFSTGVMFQYFNVGYETYGLAPYVEDGLTFYRDQPRTVSTNFYKPSVQFNFGKHFNLSRRLYLDAFVGLAYSHSFYNTDHSYYDSIFGFGYRGISPNTGFKLGVLLWDRPKK